jgi:histidinol-phosphate aminotransferase
VANAPKGSILLIDEAYIHLSGVPSALNFVKEGKDVIVLRTFSKLYGMAGIRMGFAVGRPDLLKQISTHGGFNALPITALAAAKASLLDDELVLKRRKIIGDVRVDTLDWLKSKGYACTPSVSNCFMLDVQRPGKEVLAGMAAKDIYIGRIWPAWPTQVRITVGTHDEMLAFRKAFEEVMAGNTAGLEAPKLPARLADHPFTHLS